MKTLSLIALVAALAFSASIVPASAGHLSYVDHADVPNCVIFGTNDADCETLIGVKSLITSGYAGAHPAVPPAN
jgi:hypothetical protein